MDDLYNVLWKDPEGNQHVDKKYVDIDEMENAVRRLTSGPAAIGGIVKEVLVTGTMDCTLFLWRNGKVLFPTSRE